MAAKFCLKGRKIRRVSQAGKPSSRSFLQRLPFFSNPQRNHKNLERLEEKSLEWVFAHVVGAVESPFYLSYPFQNADSSLSLALASKSRILKLRRVWFESQRTPRTAPTPHPQYTCWINPHPIVAHCAPRKFKCQNKHLVGGRIWEDRGLDAIREFLAKEPHEVPCASTHLRLISI